MERVAVRKNSLCVAEYKSLLLVTIIAHSVVLLLILSDASLKMLAKRVLVVGFIEPSIT